MSPVGRVEGIFNIECYYGTEASRLRFHGECYVYTSLHFLRRIQRVHSSRGTVAPTDVPTVFKIVEALFPRTLREIYPSDVAPEVPLFQMSELKLAAKGLDSGKAPGPDGIPNEILRAIMREKPQLILDLLNTCLERGHFPKQ